MIVEDKKIITRILSFAAEGSVSQGEECLSYSIETRCGETIGVAVEIDSCRMQTQINVSVNGRSCHQVPMVREWCSLISDLGMIEYRQRDAELDNEYKTSQDLLFKDL